MDVLAAGFHFHRANAKLKKVYLEWAGIFLGFKLFPYASVGSVVPDLAHGGKKKNGRSAIYT